MDKKQATAIPAGGDDALKKVFVISPIGSPGSEKHRKATLALDYIIRKALPNDTWEVTRGDGSLSPDSIGHDIIKRINSADLIVADLTDHNANVFYELAIAHGWNKPVIHMIERGQSIPFDIADLRVIPYELSDPASVDQTINTIAGMSVEVMKTDYKPITPLTQYRSFENVTAALDPESAQAEMNLQILNRLSAIEESVNASTNEVTHTSLKRVRDLDRIKASGLSSKFVLRAERLDMMMRNRDDYDISEFTDLVSECSVIWHSMSRTSRDETKMLLRTHGIPFPDLAEPSRVSDRSRIVNTGDK